MGIGSRFEARKMRGFCPANAHNRSGDEIVLMCRRTTPITTHEPRLPHPPFPSFTAGFARRERAGNRVASRACASRRCGAVKKGDVTLHTTTCYRWVDRPALPE